MTGDRPAWLFGAEADPLPLLDPTAAAEILGLERHSLACYRNLGGGPAFYKFGRWIRYLPSDLRAWKTSRKRLEEHQPLNCACNRHMLLDCSAAARFLTVTRFCLHNYRDSSGGPSVRRFGRRIYYSVGDLLEWAEAQRRCGAAQPTGGRGSAR